MIANTCSTFVADLSQHSRMTWSLRIMHSYPSRMRQDKHYLQHTQGRIDYTNITSPKSTLPVVVSHSRQNSHFYGAASKKEDRLALEKGHREWNLVHLFSIYLREELQIFVTHSVWIVEQGFVSIWIAHSTIQSDLIRDCLLPKDKPRSLMPTWSKGNTIVRQLESHEIQQLGCLFISEYVRALIALIIPVLILIVPRSRNKYPVACKI